MDTRFTDIAIIGMEARFPGAACIDDFWSLLCEGREGITRFSAEQLLAEGVPAEVLADSRYVPAAPVLEDYDCFDSFFFGVQAQEAETMDPQQRLLLECAWRTLEDAGYAPDATECRVGVFAGSGGLVSNHLLVHADRFDEIVGRTGGAWHLGNDKDFVPTRVSYKLNLSGPSVAVQTACSTSLVAVHLACQSIRNGECDMALAGAASVRIPHRCGYAYENGNIYSADGHVRAFDADASGVVFGSGVGLVLLKPLARALADGDNIYAVIKGSAINNDGGRKMSFMATRVDGQVDCVRTALANAAVSPEGLGYIEAHGTGTAMGDPVEILALSRAFREHTTQTGFCAIGSVKNNIGHLDIAAGIASLIKVALALKHRVIPPCIHFARPNPKIDFARSPFHVPTVLQPWESAGTPRRAGINCLGIGGTNAFMVLEEAPEHAPPAAQPMAPWSLVVLSAKSEAALWRKIDDLSSWLERGTSAALPDIAYTLALGRNSFAARCAIVADSLDALRKKLALLGRNKKADDCYVATDVRRPAEASVGLVEFARHLVRQLNAEPASKDVKAALGALADLYCRLVPIDFKALFAAGSARHIALPAYPFERRRYPVQPLRPVAAAVNVVAADATAANPGQLHPLLHRNQSDLTGLIFASTFSGEEFFLRDHVVGKMRVLPGVAQLEMVRAAVAQVTGEAIAAAGYIELRNVVWTRPIACDAAPCEVRVELASSAEGEIAFQVCSMPADGEDPVVHSQGSAFLRSGDAMPLSDVKLLKERCQSATVSGAECYERFKQLGFDYGPALRGIEQVWLGNAELVAEVALPAVLQNESSAFGLHPTLLDGTLQSAMLWSSSSDNEAPPLPFALESIEVRKPCGTRAWAWVRAAAGARAGNGPIKLDVDLYDADGEIIARLRGFTARAATTSSSPQANEPLLLLVPEWRSQPGVGAAARPYAQRIVILCGWDARFADALQAQLADTRVVVAEAGDDIAQRYNSFARSTLHVVKDVIASKPRAAVLVQVVIGERDGWASGLAGMLKTAQLEQPQIVGRLLRTPEHESAEILARRLQQAANVSDGVEVQCTEHECAARGWREQGVDASTGAPWKTHGVYLITGGAGGLGSIFAREIARHAEGARLILTGRTQPDSRIEALLQELQRSGTTAQYVSVDVTDRVAAHELIAKIESSHGMLHGILHSAGVNRDSYLLKKTTQELEAVLGPKVQGLVHLDAATAHLDLDFFALFSSTSGALGNVGQADYAAANGFMDGYAGYRNELVRQGKRRGHTVSIDWPLWAEGGMSMDAATQTLMRERFGMEPLSSETGVRAFHRALACREAQVMVLYGAVDRLRQAFVGRAERSTAASVPAIAVSDGEVADKLLASLLQEISRQIKVELRDLDADAELSEYGFDSIGLTELANRLNERFGLQLLPTVFFEYPTARSLASHLVGTHASLFAERFGRRESVTQAASDVLPAAAPAPVSLMHLRTSRRKAWSAMPGPMIHAAAASNTREPIAIVGMSGRFPQARDLDEFWDNLREGRDCIGEIPPTRWDWQAYYGDPQHEPNKTNVKWGGFIDGVDEFDPLFFHISPHEAVLMDPQQRLLMLHAWAAIEDAGYAPSSLSGTNTGIFVGTSGTGYDELIAEAQTVIEGYSSTGLVPSVGPNRMSYFLNLHGPSEPIETACSASLVAIHRALQAIQTGGCEMALVGGIQTILTPMLHISFTKAGMLCEDGRCKTFSDQANGYVRGEGVGMLLLKKLSAAEAAGDEIYAVIRGSAENHGGRANSLTAPNPKAQAELLKAAYRQAGIDVRTVSYIEAHGTGTQLGDPVEINALKAAFAELSADAPTLSPYCGLGTVKSNIGHLELAAGVAGVIKVLLQLKHRTLVPSLHCERLNPYIDLQGTAFYVVKEKQEWKALRDEQGRELPRRAGVSSFGFGGVNAHIVLEEYPENTSAEPTGSTGAALIVLSAKNESRLRAQAQKLLDALNSGRYQTDHLSRIAYTLQVGREAMEERLGFTVTSLPELIEKLQGYVSGASVEGLHGGHIKNHKEVLGLFESDQELQQALSGWIEKGKHEKLLSLWVKGLSIDWRVLYGAQRPRRIRLPTYAFATDRYWVDTTEAELNSGAVAETSISAPQEQSTLQGQPDTAGLQDRVLHKLKVLMSSLAKLPVDQLAADEPLESYGIDSLMITQLNVRFGAIFGELSKTLLYEYQTLGALAEYFASAHAQTCARWSGVSPAAPAVKSPSVAKLSAPRMQSVRTARAVATRSAAAPCVHEPIAIIGISGRYPQAKDLDALWQNLCAGVDAITEIPAERWSVDALFESDRDNAVARGRYYSRWGGFLDGFADFDALFFGISPREAYDMDPQERLFIESCWTTLEDAGYTRERLKQQHGGRVGVYAGITKTGYELHGPRLWSQGESVHPHTSFGSVANRISYLLNLSGPSLPIDTMCSSSLTAIHVACEQLYRQECELALAGGVNLYLHPANYIALCAQRMLSAEGRCRSFGAGGDGFVPGEGVGTVLLKPLSVAQRDGDVIHALIRGSSINHGGKTNGYTVPNPTAQGELIQAALQRAGISARQVSYIEAHGTGTALGDPIEIAGLKHAFEVDTQDRGFCALGSVKSNIGHLEAAAGIAGLSKLVLQLKHGQLVPSLHAQQINPNIDLEQTPFVLQRELTEWQRPVIEGREYPRLAGVSSFGAGGANAHVLVEEYQAPPRERTVIVNSQHPALFVLSARTMERLQVQAENLLSAMRSGRYQDSDVADMAYTLQVGREAMEERLGFVVTSLSDAIEKLQAFAAGSTAEIPDFHRGQARRGGKDSLALFNADEDLQAALATWITKGKFGKLLEFWVRGVAVDWSLLHGSDRPQRISLPTYPFAGKRYWIDSIAMHTQATNGDHASATSTQVQDAAGDPRSASEPQRFVPVWEATTLDELRGVETRAVAAEHSRTVIIGATPQIAAELHRYYSRAIVWNAPLDSSSERFAQLLQGTPVIDHIIWLGAPEGSEPQSDASSIVVSCFRFIKALLMEGYGARGLSWTLVTFNAHAIDDEDIPAPMQSALHGLARTMMKEYPNWPARIVDLESSSALPLAEMFDLPAADGAFAHRRGEWYRQRLLPLDYQGAASSLQSLYRTKGLYVLVGEMNPIAAAWVEWMVHHHCAQIVWVAAHDSQALPARFARLEPSPYTFVADIEDAADMERAYAEIRSREGQSICGIVSSMTLAAAGRGLAQLNEAGLAASLLAATRESKLLMQALERDSLDFMLFISSQSSFARDENAACRAFKDTMALRLARQWPGQVKIMNWEAPGGGAALDEPCSPDAIEAVHTLLALPIPQLISVNAA